MQFENWPQQVALLYESRSGPTGLARAFASGFHENGCTVDMLNRREIWSKPYDLVLGYGPSTWEGSMIPVAEQLQSIPASQRPFFLWWYIECIPNPNWPVLGIKALAHLRLAISQRIAARIDGVKPTPFVLQSLIRRGFRLQIMGEIYLFHSLGLLNGLAVTSTSRADYLVRHKYSPIVVPIGYEPKLHGEYLGLKRDIDVGFLGNVRWERRAKILARLKNELAARNITLSVQDNLYGQDRTEFLNRTKIMLNVFRAPYDFFGLRFLFCAANKALMISEPVIDKSPFEPGRHFISVPIKEMADSIHYFLDHESERLTMVEEAHRIVSQEYTIKQMVGRLLEHARSTKALV